MKGQEKNMYWSLKNSGEVLYSNLKIEVSRQRVCHL